MLYPLNELGLENSVLEFDVDTITRRSFPYGSLI